MTDLIKFLRTSTSSAYNKTAADRIKELEERNKELTLQLLAVHGQAADALDKLTKAVAFIRRHIPDSVYEQRQRANAFLAELEKTE